MYKRQDYEDLNDRLDRARVQQTMRGMPVFLGEFGVYETVPVEHRALWTREMREGLEARGLSWCHWDFAVSFKAYDKRRGVWLEPMRAALLD